MKTTESYSKSHNNKTNLITLGSLMSITLLSGVVLTSSITSADNDSVVDDVSISVPTSCTMSSSGTNSHTAEINNGQYNSAVGETTINAFCNDNAGFAIYAIGFTGSTLGSNVLANESLPSSNIATGTATSGNTSNWAMKLSTITSPAPTYPIIISGSESDTQKETGDPDYSSFQQVPDDYTKVAYRTAGTDTGTGAEGSTLKTTYQVYISPTQPAGTYEGKVKYTMVHPSTADTPSTTPALTPTSTCTTQVPGAAYMQDINASNKATILAGMTEDAEYFLRDARDNKDYCVAKLRDGNLWMTQNLDHDIDSTRTYTSQDTDIPANWTPIASTRATNDTEWNEYYDEETNPDGGDEYHAESYDPGDLYWSGTPDDSTPVSTGNSHYHLGNYYNWTAAIATDDSSSYGAYDYEVDGNANMVANQSICPVGWTLPYYSYNYDTSEPEGDFINLLSEYGWSWSDSGMTNPYIWNSPIRFILSGYYDGGSLSVIGYYGKSWSSTLDNNVEDVNTLYAHRDGSPVGYDTTYRPTGISIRCLAR